MKCHPASRALQRSSTRRRVNGARTYLATIGATPFPPTPQELATFQETDTRRWVEIVETAKIEKK